MRILLVGFIMLIAGCNLIPPYHTTTKYFIVFDNQLSTPINITNLSQNAGNDPFIIDPNAKDLTYDYEAESNSSPLPSWLEKLHFNIDNCEFKLDREELEEAFARNTEGYPWWELVIDKEFVSEFGC